jgi:hypothetical protein
MPPAGIIRGARRFAPVSDRAKAPLGDAPPLDLSSNASNTNSVGTMSPASCLTGQPRQAGGGENLWGAGSSASSSQPPPPQPHSATSALPSQASPSTVRTAPLTNGTGCGLAPLTAGPISPTTMQTPATTFTPSTGKTPCSADFAAHFGGHHHPHYPHGGHHSSAVQQQSAAACSSSSSGLAAVVGAHSDEDGERAARDAALYARLERQYGGIPQGPIVPQGASPRQGGGGGARQVSHGISATPPPQNHPLHHTPLHGHGVATPQPQKLASEFVKIKVLDETSKASLVLHWRHDKDSGKWSQVVEKRMRDPAKARKELEQYDLGCAHPNLVRYLFKKHNSDTSESVFLEYINLGSLRGIQDAWADIQERHDQRRSAQMRALSTSSFTAASKVTTSASTTNLSGLGLNTSDVEMGSTAGSLYEIGELAGDDASCASGNCSRLPTPIERILLCRSIGTQTLQGLAYYHVVQGRFHRDIKPGNILLKDDGRVKLCDFDACKNACDSGATYDGTASYMAPEIARCMTHRVKGTVDVWSVGIVLYELATGRHPFTDISMNNLLTNIEGIIDELDYSAVAHDDLRDLIRKCLKVDPDKRIDVLTAMRHPFFTVELNDALRGADRSNKQVTENEIESFVTRFNQVPLSKPESKAVEMMQSRGIEVNADTPELELVTWRTVRDAPGADSKTGLPIAESQWRRETDDVMKRLVHLRQQRDGYALKHVLRLLGHKATKYEEPSASARHAR